MLTHWPRIILTSVVLVAAAACLDFRPRTRFDPETLVLEPIVDLGEVTGDEAHGFYSTNNMFRLPGGRFAVADPRGLQIRLHDSTGTEVRSVSTGKSPGVLFPALTWLDGFSGDSLVTFDSHLNRFSVFDSNLDFVRSIDLVLPASIGRRVRPAPVGVLADGSVLIVSNGGIGRRARGLSTDSTHVLRVNLASGAATDLGVFPRVQTYTTNNANYSAIETPFTPRGLFAPWGSGFLFGFGDTPMLFVYSETGQLMDTIPLPLHPERAITPWEINRFKHHSWSQPPVDSSNTRAKALDEAIFPAAFPIFDRVLTTADSLIWIREYLGIDGSRWNIVRPDGRLQGRLELPSSFIPMQIDGTTLLGRWRDDWDIAHVGAYRLISKAANDTRGR